MFWVVLFFVGLTATAWAQTEPATAWGWMAGSSTAVNVNGVYNGVGAAGTPGSRIGGATWTDQSGNLWLFGGDGYDAVGNIVFLNDLWEFTGGQWIFKSGSTTVPAVQCIAGNYLTKGTANAANIVGGRSNAATAVDANGNLWLFGGLGCGATGTDNLNDLWMYNINSGLWTWISGSTTVDQTGTYGAKGVASASFLPGARAYTAAWSGSDGSLWILGGSGYDSNGTNGELNDLWKFDPVAKTWTWVAGSLLKNQLGSYGSLGVAAAANTPGSRFAGAAAVDPNGNLWLTGGAGYGSANNGLLNDLWKFDIVAQQWIWEAGSQSVNPAGVYGTQYAAAVGSHPGGRYLAGFWSDAAGNLWLFGGFGYDSADASNSLNDFWEFDATTSQWSWMGGATTIAAAENAAFGSLGSPATTNLPGGLYDQSLWNDGHGNFWMQGGTGYISPATSGTLNDLWEAIPPAPTPSFSLAAGTYTGSQTVAISEAMSGDIYYTTNGNTPTSASTEYSGPVAISSTATLQAIAVVSGRAQSLVRSVAYTIQQTPVVSWTPAQTTITYGTTLAGLLNPSASYGGSPVAGNYSFTTETGATVTALSVLPAGTHTLTATLSPTLSALYTTATASVQLIVKQATPTINWGAAGILPAIGYGTALGASQLDATATGIPADGQLTGTLTYSPDAGTVLQAGTTPLTVTFVPNNSNYATTGGSVTITVNKVTPTVSWLTPAAITYGTHLSTTQLNATATVPGTFTYIPASGVLLTAGTQTLSVNFTPTDTVDYTTPPPPAATVQLVVNQAVDTATWPTPQAINYGTVLGATQLNASCLYASQPIAYTEGGISVSGATLTAGTHTLTATCTPTDSTDYSSGSVTVQLVVNKATPTITWSPTPLPSLTYGSALTASQLNATCSLGVQSTTVFTTESGQPVIVGYAALTAGTHTLTATCTPTDTTDYNTASSAMQLVVNQAVPLITWGALTPITYATALSATQLNASAAFGGAAVAGAFSYSPAAGTTTLPVGNTTLTATFTPTDTTDYATVNKTVQLTVTQATPILTWTAPVAIPYGTPLSATQLNVAANVPGSFSYNPALGSVLAAGPHTLSVIFTPDDATDYTTASTTVALTVTQVTPTITWATPAAITYRTALSGTQLNATANVAGTFAYTPSSGILTVGPHTLSVTFTPTDGVDYTPVSATVVLTVNQATPTIAWANPAAITYGTALSVAQLNAVPSVPGTVTYAPVAGTILAAGSHTLTATFVPNDAVDYAGATATVTLQVNQAPPAITWATPASIVYGTALSGTQLNATAAFGGAPVAGTFAYSPAAGTVLQAGAQTLEVTFTPTDTTDYATVTATVTINVTAAAPVVSWATPAAILYGTPLSATQLNATASVPGTFIYNPAAGTVLASGARTLSVTFTPSDATDYQQVTKTVILQVNATAPTITWATPTPIVYGTALSATQLNATASYNGVTVPGQFTYNPASGTVLTAGNQTLTVSFIPTDATNYTQATGSVTLLVTQATPVATWLAPAAITYGTPLGSTQLNAVANVAGVWSYNPGQGAILPAGTQTLTATFTPTDWTDYHSTTATTTITVNKATPVLNWIAPASIPSGTALSATQLNATANVPGTFVYTPAAGTVLTAGLQTLTVVFTPSDSADYTTATASVQLTITASDFTIMGSPTAQILPPGGSTIYILTVTPQNGPYNSTVTFSVTGLPSGITATFSPASVIPGSAAVSASMTVSHTATTASNALRLGGAMTPFLALLLGFGFRRVRKARRFWMVLLLTLSLGATVALSGCGGKINLAQNYTITVTGTAGSNVHSTLLVLTVQ